ncbi:hypothetical protein [Massilia sp. H6]|uniref:hypothetical protein n=1 Tax=Massilia sp. H6 TaxID=2970464 RepID=UPI00216A62DB|nr:hypothetical protein [Massilia sp. H6]UVW27033.1 hypothetical protein NRS07_10660 [Massilia sp. H6]
MRSTRWVLVLLLTVAMVFAHWQGLAHRVAHRSQAVLAPASAGAGTGANTHQKALQHSCLAYDAATVAPALDRPGCSAALLPGGRALVLLATYRSWDAPPTIQFHSRAPPFA